VQDASPLPVTVIANSTNLGFPAAINQGLKYARGEYLVLLSNDAVVTGGWLEQLVALTNAKTGDDRFAGIDAGGAGIIPSDDTSARSIGVAGGVGTVPVDAGGGVQAPGSAGTTHTDPTTARGVEAFGSAGATPEQQEESEPLIAPGLPRWDRRRNRSR
jgi:hypothetical protein